MALANGIQISREEIVALHEEHHMGVENTKYFAELNNPEKVVNVELVREVVSQCPRCQSIDPSSVRWDEGSLHVEGIWERLALDVTHFDGDKYLTVIDCGPSRYAIWRKLRNESSCSLTTEFEHLFREFGPPKEIVLDNSAAFRSEDMKVQCERWKIQLIFRCAYRPSCNGIIERHHRTVKRMAARCGRPVLEIILYYNIAPSSISGKPPCQQLFNYHWRYPLRYCSDQEIVSNNTFKIGESVYVKPPNVTCTEEWQVGTVTGSGTARKIEVDGYPRHISDIRKIQNSNTDLLDPIFHPDFERENIHPHEIEVMSPFERDKHLQTGPVEAGETTDLCYSQQTASYDENREQRPLRERHKPKFLEDYITY